MDGDARAGSRPPTSHVEINRGLVAVNALSSVFTHLISVGVLLWANQYLLKRLSPEEYAPFPVVVALVLFLQVFMSILTGGIARFITEAYAKGDFRRVTEIVSSMVPLLFIAVLIFWGLGGLAAWKVGSLLNVDPGQISNARLMLGLMVVGNGLVLMAIPFTVGLHVRQKFIWVNLIKLGEQILRFVLLLFFLLEVSTSAHWLVVASQIALLTATCVTLVLSRRLIPELRLDPRAFRVSIMRELTSFGGWMMLGNLLNRIRTSADIIILNRLSTAVDVTSFHVGRLPDRQIDVLMAMVSVTMQPALIAMHATERQESLRRAYLRGNRYHLWAILAVAVPLFVFADELVILYAGETYILAAMILKLKCASYPISYASHMLYLVSVATARVRSYFLTISVGSGLHLAAAIVLVGYFHLGALGIAYASFALVFLIQLGLLWPLGLRMVQLPFGRFARETLLPGYLPAAGGVAAGFALKAALQPDSWLSVGIGVAGCLFVYGLLMAVASTGDDRRDVVILLRHLKSKLAPETAPRMGSAG